MRSRFLRLLTAAAPALLLLSIASMARADDPPACTSDVTVTGTANATFTANPAGQVGTWHVIPGASYTATIANVSSDCTGNAITVHYANSGTIYDFNATRVGTSNTFSGTFTFYGTCQTGPISYDCGADTNLGNQGAYNPNGTCTNQVHFGASTDGTAAGDIKDCTAVCTITCPPNKTVDADCTLGGTGVAVVLDATTSCPGAITYTAKYPGATTAVPVNSGDVFPVGTTVVTASVVGSGAVPCSFNVTVNQKPCPPKITCADNPQAVCNTKGLCTASVAILMPTAIGNPTPVVVGTYTQGGQTQTITASGTYLFDVGTTWITWTATNPDHQELTSQCSNKVTVNDCDITLTCSGDIKACLATSAGTVIPNIAGPTATTLCLGTPVDLVAAGWTVTPDRDLTQAFPCGDTTITWTATNGDRTATCKQKVTVTGVQIKAHKFYDVSDLGLGGAAVQGVRFQLFDSTNTLVGTATSDVNGDAVFTTTCLPQGTYKIHEIEPIGWYPTTPIDQVVNTADSTCTSGDTCSACATFGDVCLGGGGGLTLGFWSNSNGQAIMKSTDNYVSVLAFLSGLNLRNANGSNFDPTSYTAFRTWILGATATNMANMLSAQLAAMELNVRYGKVSASAIVYAPGSVNANTFGFVSVGTLMDEANTELGLHGYTVISDATRTYQEALKTALDKANNNLNFIGKSQCPVTYAN